MATGLSNMHAFKLNLKNIQLIKGVLESQEEIITEVARIKSLAEEGYKETLLPGCNTIIKNATKVLSRPEANTHANCQIYLIQINSLLNSISDVELKLEDTLGDSDDIVLGLRDAVKHIGSVFSDQIQNMN